MTTIDLGGARLEAAVHQSLLGSTRVTLLRDDVEVAERKGFVA